MPYVTKEQLAARLGPAMYARLTDRVAGETADEAVGQAIVDEASGLADGWLAVRYATPVDLVGHPEVTDILAARVLDLAESIAWQSSPFVGDIPDRIRFLAEDARRWFERLARGDVNLPAASPPPGRTAVTDEPLASSSPRVFTSDELDGL